MSHTFGIAIIVLIVTIVGYHTIICTQTHNSIDYDRRAKYSFDNPFTPSTRKPSYDDTTEKLKNGRTPKPLMAWSKKDIQTNRNENIKIPNGQTCKLYKLQNIKIFNGQPCKFYELVFKSDQLKPDYAAKLLANCLFASAL
ncbi:uncharacterized protein LOC106094403 isoform X1 [Stomoxys calcitrans]|uniref:uncharacterized protein LOC106094403 isoform X1 n=1 Tax=Stomoxys calcitrans TaxID=35570 RepID=UPI0027E37C76|nr:uncharacterized protein LOC106094403 isoform X1 [Stomoxys calcitrans]XP_059222208.1 uncharacterized protein LOC106094403 isoform X1 [Stomoxys calcitrans]